MNERTANLIIGFLIGAIAATVVIYWRDVKLLYDKRQALSATVRLIQDYQDLKDGL